MDAMLYIKMLSDKSITNLRKLQYKYSSSDVAEFVQLLKDSVYTSLPLSDFHGNSCVYLKNIVQQTSAPAKILLLPQKDTYGKDAMEEEVYSTLAIESIDSSRESIRKIFKGYAPSGHAEDRIYSMKKGLDFICNKANAITEENIYHLYEIAIADFLDEEDKLLPGMYYRHDTVFVVGTEVEHTGIDHTKLSKHMKNLVTFINAKDDMDDLQKAAAIHFYFGYLHPYFDGNGRMARLLHQWYLVHAIIREGQTAFMLPMTRRTHLEERSDAPFGAQQIIRMRLEELLILLLRAQTCPQPFRLNARYDDDIAGLYCRSSRTSRTPGTARMASREP